MAHAHGEGGEGEIGAGLEVVAEVAEGGEVGAGGFGVFFVRGDGHEAVDLEAVEGEEVVELGGEVGGGEAVFGGFGGDVDFEEDAGAEVEFGGDAVDVAGDVEGVDALDDFDVGKDFADFVALEGSDEMPAEVRGEEGGFGEDFLDAVFAEEGLACVDGFLDGFDREGFGDGHEFDGGGVAIGAGGGAVEAFADGGEAVEEGDHGGRGQ